jgi:hypothetical protein
VITYLEINDEVLCLHVLHDVLLLVFKDSAAQINLVVYPHYNTQTDILTNVSPVQVVPETLLQPVKAYLNK